MYLYKIRFCQIINLFCYSNNFFQIEVDAPLNIRCSKGINLQFTGADKNNPGFLNGPRLWRVGETTDKRDTRIRYGVMTHKIVLTSQMTILKTARYSYLWNVSGDHNLKVKINTGDEISIPFVGRLLDHWSLSTSDSTKYTLDLFSVKAGDYTDDFTFILTF